MGDTRKDPIVKKDFITKKDSLITAANLVAIKARETKLQLELSTKYKIPVEIFLRRDSVDDRFNQVKAIMHAVGVTDLSSLATLKITTHTRMLPGTILRAPKATVSPNWQRLATEFVGSVTANTNLASELIDAQLPTRHVAAARVKAVKSEQLSLRKPLSALVTKLKDTDLVASTTVLRDSGPLIERPLNEVATSLAESVTAAKAVELIKGDKPGDWPVSVIEPVAIRSSVLPVNSAVIIADRLDLTNQTLEIDPMVDTLYIIVREILATKGAKITWKRPQLDVPNHGSDPALDGNPNWSGIHTGPKGKHGLPGGSARSGKPGVTGRSGTDAPNVEIWALRAKGLPDIDLSGQRGGQGGRGQAGGRGGRGANGEAAHAFIVCTSQPGNGGDGGHGGDGGRGGRGGDGGDGGNILFAVLDESLSALTTSNAFTPNLSGGAGGPGGDGGGRGEGGRGGRHGARGPCSGGKDGAQGQPGNVGARGAAGAKGSDAKMQIMTVTEESWNEQLTKPWLYNLVPNNALPGSTVILKGSRFADTDVVRIGTTTVTGRLRADEALDVTLPGSLAGGMHELYLRRHDGQESNRLRLGIRPEITSDVPFVTPGQPATITGRAFLADATVEYADGHYPADVKSATELTFTVPETAAMVSREQNVTLTVVNPDGLRSNTKSSVVPRTLRTGFQLGVHNFAFDNDSDGRPSWSTFEDTFGALEVWHQQVDPIFGNPILTRAFFEFYKHFLKGKDNGGLATGFCTSLACEALDRFWLGRNDTYDTVVRDDAFRAHLTGIHGKLLSRESLIGFHDQSRRGQANVATTFRTIEENFLSGGTRESAPLLFFVPSGAAWDAGYFESLKSSHCIVPIRIVYPPGADATTSLEGVKLYCWENNSPRNAEAVLTFRVIDGETRFTYTVNGNKKFASEDKITLATMSLGQYLLADHDLPFSGPFGVTRFVVDFLLSPATMSAVDDAGRVTGQVGNQILAEIPGSHPMYLVPNGYLLPSGVGLTRRITGTAAGTYTYGSLSPEGTHVSLNDVPTTQGDVDRVLISGDATRMRFIPTQAKTVGLTLGREAEGHARGLSVTGVAASPTSDLDVTVTPDLSLVRLENTGPETQVDVSLLDFQLADGNRRAVARPAVQVPADSDLVIAVTDWPGLTQDTVTTTVVSR